MIKIGVISENLIENEVRRLSGEHRAAIRETFQAIHSDLVHSGLCIFVRLFSDHPEYKNIWPQFRGIADSALVSSDAVRRHACVYMAGLKTVIDNINDEKNLGELISRMAISHVKWKISKQHVMNMIPGVLQSVKSNTGNCDPLTTNAWTTFYDVIGNLIEGFKKMQNEANGTTMKH